MEEDRKDEKQEGKKTEEKGKPGEDIKIEEKREAGAEMNAGGQEEWKSGKKVRRDKNKIKKKERRQWNRGSHRKIQRGEVRAGERPKK